MELRDYLRVLRRYWLLILAALLVFLAAGALYILLVTPQYEATSRLYVSVRGTGQDTSELEQGSSYARGSVQSYVRITTTASVLQPVIDELGLRTSVARLAEDVTAQVPSDTSLIEITARTDSASSAADVANAISQSLTRVIQEELEVTGSPATADTPSQLVRITPVDPATVPERPVVPQVKLILAAVTLAGLVVGVGVALLLSALDTRVRTAEEAESATGVPVIGAIPKDPAPRRSTPLNTAGSGVRAEAYKNIRTNLQFLAGAETGEGQGQAFVLTSSRVSEGKSTTTANLGRTLAGAGHKVAVIDADLRLPKLAEHFGIEGGAGLTDVLIGRAGLADVIQPWGEFELDVLPSGPVPPNPSELLGRKAMGLLVRELRETYDFILIDSPPLLAVTDAAVVSKYSDGLLLVVSVAGTKKHDLQATARQIAAAGAQLRGIILNMFPRNGFADAGYGYEYGGYASTTTPGGEG